MCCSSAGTKVGYQPIPAVTREPCWSGFRCRDTLCLPLPPSVCVCAECSGAACFHGLFCVPFSWQANATEKLGHWQSSRDNSLCPHTALAFTLLLRVVQVAQRHRGKDSYHQPLVAIRQQAERGGQTWSGDTAARGVPKLHSTLSHSCAGPLQCHPPCPLLSKSQETKRKAGSVCLETRYCSSGRCCVGPGRASRRTHLVSPGPCKPEALTCDGCFLSQAMEGALF